MATIKHFPRYIIQTMLRIIVLSCLVFLAGCAAFQTKTEHVGVFGIPWTAKLGHHAEVPNQLSIDEFIREGDDINNWQELLTIANSSKSWGGSSPEDALNNLKVIRERGCPGQTKWSIIKKDENSVLYEWQARPCLGWPDQHEIAIIIDGQYNRFRIAYTAKMYQLPPDRRNQWINVISSAKVRGGTVRRD